eukprot:COSAG02_NODE_78798_length_115_cov_30.000000_1_plen_38_part_11
MWTSLEYELVVRLRSSNVTRSVNEIHKLCSADSVRAEK